MGPSLLGPARVLGLIGLGLGICVLNWDYHVIQYFAGKSTQQWETELVGGGVYWPPRLIPDSPGFHPTLLGLEALEIPFFFSFSFTLNPFFPIVMHPLCSNLLYCNLLGFFVQFCIHSTLSAFTALLLSTPVCALTLWSFLFHSLLLHSVSSPENQSPSVHSVTDWLMPLLQGWHHVSAPSKSV